MTNQIDRVFRSADPGAAYNNLSREERQEFDGRFKLAYVETQSEASNSVTGTRLEEDQVKELERGMVEGVVPQAYTGCWNVKYWTAGKSGLGLTLIKYGQRTNVCVTNGRVNSVYVSDVWDEIVGFGWKKAKEPQSQVSNVGWEGRGRTQWFFVLGAGGWELQNPTPCVQNRLNADGVHYLASLSCDLG